jgi:ribosome biogenesis protein SSF1/2
MRRNKLKDFIVNARPLGVSHMLMLSKSDTHVNMRMCRLPHGPTLTFQGERARAHRNSTLLNCSVVAYTLSRDIAAAARRPVAYEQHLRTQPLIVMNEFGATDAAGHPTPPPRHLRLTQTIMQNMFSKLRVDAAVQSNIKRCILINHDTDTDLIDWRHYIIKTTPQLTANRSVRKLTADVKPSKAVPDLSRYADISDFVLKPEPAGSDSETDGELTLVDTEPSTLSKRALPTTVMSGKSRVKLVEIGPRMTLRLTKIEEGVCAGAVMYHAFEQRTSDEQREQRMQLLMAQ